jgi:hypothetical protein
MVTAVRTQTGSGVGSVLAGERISSDRSSISSTVAILSKQLPLPTAQQWAGQTVNAKMVGQAPDGQVQVELDGQTVTVALPSNAKLPNVGDSILLTLALDPEIAQQQVSLSGVAAPKQLVGLTKLDKLTNEISSDSNESTVDDLSSTGKLLGAIESLSKSQIGGVTVRLPVTPIFSNERGSDGSAFSDSKPESVSATILPNLSSNPNDVDNNIDNTNLVSENTNKSNKSGAIGNLSKAKQSDATEQIAKSVSEAVEHSGLFYESHLQQWVEGGRSAEELFKEPQAAWDKSQMISENAQSKGDALPPSAKLVSSQLQLLDQPKLNITFPGQTGEPIDVSIEPQYDRNAQIDTPEQVWAARLKLDMPQLGPVEARVRLVGNTLDINLTASKGSLPLINQSWKDIESALGNIGISLSHGQVSPKEPEA